MKKISKWITDIFATAGAIGVSIGAWLIYVPAGVITLGTFFIGAAIIFSKAGVGE